MAVQVVNRSTGKVRWSDINAKSFDIRGDGTLVVLDEEGGTRAAFQLDKDDYVRKVY